MTTFDEREQAFETKFAHDAEMQFKANARRTRNLGLWAAHELGLEGEAAVEYAKSLMSLWLAHSGFEHVVERVVADARDRGRELAPEAVRREADRLLAESKAALMGQAG